MHDWERIEAELAVARGGPPVSLDVVRHGETTMNAASRISGAADVQLTDRGRAQAMQLGERLRGTYDAVFQSHLRRSQETLRLAMEASGSSSSRVITDSRIAERSMGELEGQESRPLPAYDRGDLFWAPPGGEPYVEVARRILSFLLHLQDEVRRSAREACVLICTHVGPMRVLVAILGRATDPRDVTRSQFGNATIWRASFTELERPAFLPPDPLRRS